MNKKLIALISVILVLVALTASFVTGVVVGGTVVKEPRAPKPSTSFETADDLGLIKEVLGEVAHGYVEKTKRAKLIDGAVNGLLKSLDDPYTRRLKKSAYGDFQDQTAGHFGGVGMELGMRDDKLTVVAPIKNTPAEKAGIVAGDRIDKIDDRSTKGMSVEEAVKLIRGPDGTKVTLSFDRKDAMPFSRTLTREQIKLPNISSKILDKDIGYIKVHQFNSETSKDVQRELSDLKTLKAKGVIVDLRNNPGGLLNEAVAVSSIFIKSGPIVKIKSRTGKTDTMSASPGADDQIPLVLLVNQGSASASEIFAGAVQDTGRGVIVGEKTFGKGSVQTVIPLSDGSGLIMTTAVYLTPKNRSLNKHGIKPDVVIKLDKKDWHKMSGPDDPQLIKAKEAIRDLMAGKEVKKAG